jgi:hypothetical protein
MNLNNLEDLKNEVKGLGFNPKLADELEKNMKNLPGYFTLKDQVPGDKGQIDLTLHFRKSNQSDFFSFNKVEVSAGKLPPIAENQHYMVISANANDPQKPLVREFQSPNEAIEFFKKQKGNSELGIGESSEAKQLLASKESGKINYVNKDFRSAFFTPPVTQTFYLDNGKGFTAEQAVNMVQDRTVYRNDMLSTQGDTYKAWIKLDFEQPKDQWNNHKLKQYHDPSYGFDLDSTLKRYAIKELADPKQKEALVEAMKNGNRVEVTTLKDSKEMKVFAEAVPRYGNLAFFNDKGRSEKREQFEKPVLQSQQQTKGHGKNNAPEQEEKRGVSVR